MAEFIDITGQKFGRLTVIRFLEPEERVLRRKSWLCQCDCGNIVHMDGAKLRSGHTRSCGCLCVESARNINLKYKYSYKRLYAVYKHMIQRCKDPKEREYHNYGGRGIKVCKEWLDNYDTFAEWAFTSGYDLSAKRGECTLDRINVDKDYEPNNCRWVSNQIQQNNRRDCMYAEYNGEVHTCMEWSKILGMTYQKVHYHMKLGRSIEYIINC